MSITLEDLDFDLPAGQIAGEALEVRSASRMLMVDRAAGTFRDSHFVHLPDLLEPGDLLVLNNTKVFPARLFGRTETGASVELFLVEDLGDDRWSALAKPAKRLRLGKKLVFAPDLAAVVEEKQEDGRLVVFFDADGDLPGAVDRYGRTPLPPYIKRDRDAADLDKARYQTVYASERGAIAAPTAGLHFTPEVLDGLRNRGVEIAEITLHVGYGTFEPVRAEDLSDHRVAPERYSISEATAAQLNSAKQSGRRMIAVGTTTTRTLEYALNADGEFRSGSGRADLTILPGYKFKAIDGLLTNFHLPKSSLLILVSTFGGHELIMNAYRHSVASGYRFYSYGDCMLIV